MKKKILGPTLGWITTSAKYIFESPWVRIRQDRVRVKDKDLTFTFLEHGGSVFIFPLTRDGRVVLIRTYRYYVDDWVWQLPAGGISDKPGLSLEEVAREELEEETGYTGGTFESIGTYYTAVGAMALEINIFLARGVELTAKQNLEAGEYIDQVALVSLEDAVAKARSGEIKDGESALAILLAAARLH